MADAFLPDEDLSNRPPQYQWRDNGYVYWAGYDTRKRWSGDHLREIKAHYYGLITDEWKLVHYGSSPYGELYHEKEDPHDTVNLWDDPGYAPKRAELTDRLLSEMGPGNDTIHRLIARQVEEPIGAHRDPRLMETSPPYARDEREWRRDGFG